MLVAGTACRQGSSAESSGAPVTIAATSTLADEEKASTTHPTNEPVDLWGRTFVSRSITASGAPVALYDNVNVTVHFEQRAIGGVMQWHADCNFMGGSVVVDRERLTITEAGGTAIGCPNDRADRDCWITEFMWASPRWTLDTNGLVLDAIDARIVLVPA
jgi:heat shock protein HslJ